MVSLVGGLDFTITEYPNPIIQAGGSTTFKLEFIPSTGGAASVRIDIASNDPKTPVHSITVTAHGTLDPRPQLEVKRDLGGALAISAGSQVNLGYSVPDIPQDFPFIIRNAGASQALFATVATNAPQFSILAQPVSPIASGAISSFILRFIVAANDTNLYSTEVTVTCNDPDYAAIPYVFTAKCQGSNAKMQVKDGATSLSPVGATPATLALGSVSVGSNLSRSLSVANGGTGDMHLILSPAARFSGGDAGLFSISAQPAETITSGTPSSLTLKFEPMTYGSFSVTLSIPNTSGDFPDYALTVTGTGLAPDLKLALGGTPIARDGAAPPWPDTNYLTQSEATFTIQNVGNSALTLGGGAVSLSGTDASKFVITQQPPSSIAASSSGVFKIAFAPTTLGSKSAIATISSNDPGKPSFALSLSGIGKAPMVALSSGSGPIASGSTLAFPEAIYKRSQSNATITVSNSGTLPLSVTAIALGGTNASDFNLTASLPMNIAAGSSTTFSLALKTDTVGIKSAGVTAS